MLHCQGLSETLIGRNVIFDKLKRVHYFTTHTVSANRWKGCFFGSDKNLLILKFKYVILKKV